MVSDFNGLCLVCSWSLDCRAQLVARQVRNGCGEAAKPPGGCLAFGLPKKQAECQLSINPYSIETFYFIAGGMPLDLFKPCLPGNQGYQGCSGYSTTCT